MIIKCPKCGGSVVYDVESGMMCCTSCEERFDNATWAELEGLQQSDTDSEQPEEQNKEPENKQGFRLASESDEPKQKKGFRLASDAGSTNASKQRWTDSLHRKEARSFENQSIGDEDLKKEERIISYINLNLYKCTSCGAQLMLSGTEASTFCSFCGLPTVVFDRISKEEKPDKIIPFKLTKEQALLCIKDRMGYGKFVPDEIKNLSVEEIRGIYIPYWLYTSHIRRKMTIKRSSSGHVHTYHRDASCTYENMTADAVLNLNNVLSSRLDPFYMHELEDFDASYLSGFYADKYDVPADAVQASMQKTARTALDDTIYKSCNAVGYTTTSDVEEEYNVENIQYALLPAYFVTLRYGSTVHMVLVNGQTGKVVTDVPANLGKIKRQMTKNIIIACIIYAIVDVLCLSLNTWMGILIPIFTLFFVVTGGYFAKKAYDEESYHLRSSAMNSYVHNRD